MSLTNCHVTTTTPLPSTSAKWLSLVQHTYTDPHGHPRTWESAERLSRPPGVSFDGVGILCILRRPGASPTVLLQRQFRPSINAICVELPAGLVDAGETAEECAVRELREETGYVGTVIGGDRSPLMWNDPGMCNTNLYMVEVEVDLSCEENRRPKQGLEEGEFIECFEVELGRLWEEMRGWEEREWAVDARVGTLAMGLEVGRRFEVNK